MHTCIHHSVIHISIKPVNKAASRTSDQFIGLVLETEKEEEEEKHRDRETKMRDTP